MWFEKRWFVSVNDLWCLTVSVCCRSSIPNTRVSPSSLWCGGRAAGGTCESLMLPALHFHILTGCLLYLKCSFVCLQSEAVVSEQRRVQLHHFRRSSCHAAAFHWSKMNKSNVYYQLNDHESRSEWLFIVTLSVSHMRPVSFLSNVHDTDFLFNLFTD